MIAGELTGYGPKSPCLVFQFWPPLKPGASDMVVSAGGLPAFASPRAVVGASLAAAWLFTRAGGALPALPPPRAIALPAPAGVTCLGGALVSGETLGLASAAGPKGSAMPSASCRSEGMQQVSEPAPRYDVL